MVRSKPVTASVHKKPPLRRLMESWQLYVLLLPTMAYMFVFNYVPMYGLQIAFRNYEARSGFWGSTWVGVRHFRDFFSSPQFSQLLINTLRISLTSLVFSFPLPILLALLMNEVKNRRVKKWIQNITYAPYFISTVILVSIINVFLARTDGLINQLLRSMGGESVDFLGKARLFVPIYVISSLWQHTGWSSIIYIAALSGVDLELHDAAQIDGAKLVQRIWHINLPCILPTAVIMFVLSCGHIMSVGYEKIYLMQNSINLSISEVISTYVYKVGLIKVQFSYTTAIGLFNNVINVALLLLSNYMARKLTDVSLF
ncbi:MAG: sugar ABC transporter permease [Clostridia bacterium]|nr:sugar ABC transporter permease [Clostridia bacterium]